MNNQIINLERNTKLRLLVIDNILCSQDQIKNMAVAYMVSADDEIINWIDVSNNHVQFTKAEFGGLIKRATQAVAMIYFEARAAKDAPEIDEGE